MRERRRTFLPYIPLDLSVSSLQPQLALSRLQLDHGSLLHSKIVLNDAQHATSSTRLELENNINFSACAVIIIDVDRSFRRLGVATELKPFTACDCVPDDGDSVD